MTTASDPKQTFCFGRSLGTPDQGAARLYSSMRMKIRVDSDEYKCWHEVGHATVCLHLGGDVDFIEFLDGDTRGHARTRCVITSSELERTVALGGFAAEFYLLKNRHAEQAPDDEGKSIRLSFTTPRTTVRISGDASAVANLRRRKTRSLGTAQ